MFGSDFFFFGNAWQYSDEELIRSIYSKLYLGKELIVPSEVIVSFDYDGKVFEEYLYQKKSCRIKTVFPRGGEKKRLLSMALNNAKEKLEQEINRKISNKKLLKEVQLKLGLKRLPINIECYDISNTVGVNSVGCMVSVKDAQFNKRNYRKYKIKTVKGADDFGSMRELLQRRLRRAQTNELPLPDLIIIDGGIGQLRAVERAFEEMEIDNAQLDLIALAKGKAEKKRNLQQKNYNFEYILKSFYEEPIFLPFNSKTLHFLQKIRDEVHRFALAYHQKKRADNSFSSILPEIEGIGPVKQKILIKHFGNLDKIKNSVPLQLAKVKGISLKNAKNIYKFFHS